MSPLSVAGKIAIVTGAGSGINFSFAKLLLQKGCSVVMGDLALRPEAEKLLADYTYTKGGSKASAVFQRTDVTSWPQLSALFDKGLSSYGRVDIVVPGAGVFEPPFSGFWNPPKTATNPDTPSRDDANGEPGSYKQIEVNLTHPIRLSQLSIGYWTKNKMPGTLVHVSSIAGHAAGIGPPIYHATKFGLHGFVRSLGILKESCGIRVSAIAPGAVNTPMWTEAPDKKHLTRGDKDIPISPETIADGMLELCENPEYGDGTILECINNHNRVVPLYNADPPPTEALAMPAVAEDYARIIKKLQTDGLNV